MRFKLYFFIYTTTFHKVAVPTLYSQLYPINVVHSSYNKWFTFKFNFKSNGASCCIHNILRHSHFEIPTLVSITIYKEKIS